MDGRSFFIDFQSSGVPTTAAVCLSVGYDVREYFSLTETSCGKTENSKMDGSKARIRR